MFGGLVLLLLVILGGGAWWSRGFPIEASLPQMETPAGVKRAEFTVKNQASPTAKISATAERSLSASPTSPPPTRTPLPTATGLPTKAASITPTPAPATCRPPSDWGIMVVPNGESIESIAAISGIAPEELQHANCLAEPALRPGMVLYVPPPLTATPEPTVTHIPKVCEPPWGWVSYLVQEGDTLESLADYYNLGASKIQQANCMGDRSDIWPGQVIYVPVEPRK